MPFQSVLGRGDYEDYLIRLYFGAENNAMLACSNRAYLDFCRTMHGYSHLPINMQASTKNDAEDTLISALNALKTTLLSGQINAQIFDDWHRVTCLSLITVYQNIPFPFFVGQAQKWVNMTLKYIYTHGNVRIPGFDAAYPYCHVPFDNVILGELVKHYQFRDFTKSWSRIDNYTDYTERQKWIRNRFKMIPLDVEFYLWAGKKNLVS